MTHAGDTAIGRTASLGARLIAGLVAVLALGGAGACGKNDQGSPVDTTVPVATTGVRPPGSVLPAEPGTTAATPPDGSGSTAVTAGATSSTVAITPSTTTPPAGPASSVTTPTTTPGGSTGPTVTIAPSQVQQIPAGTSPEEKAWCVQAKPLSQALNRMWTLSQPQFETLVSQAFDLKKTAPPAIQTQLGQLADVGSRFLEAVKSRQATISADGITRWANQNLTPAEQVAFLQSAGAVTSYINRTC